MKNFRDGGIHDRAVLTSAATTRESLEEACPLSVTAIHDAHADFVWRSLQRLGVHVTDIDDAFQEVFVIVHKRLHTYNGSSKLTTWLFGICFRVVAGLRRRAWFRRARGLSEAADDLQAPESGRPDALLAAEQARRTVHLVLDKMDLAKRAVFVMFEIEELSSEEIAVTLGVPRGTVFSRLHAARQQFQSILNRLDKLEGGIR